MAENAESMTSRLKTNLKYAFICMVVGLIALTSFRYYRSPEQRLRRQIIKEFSCSSNEINLERIGFAFKVEVCDRNYVFIECGCCDIQWFQQCRPASDKYWIGLCDSEARHCLDTCMEARELTGVGDFLSSEILCKEIDDEYESQYRGNEN